MLCRTLLICKNETIIVDETLKPEWELELIMKNYITLLFLGSFGLWSVAADLSWETNFEKAKQLASKENKQILINFTGSDWCGWCKRLDREVFRKDSFTTFVTKELVLLKVDFPKFTPLPRAQREMNEALARKFGVNGFPAILLVDATGKLLHRTGYQRGGAERYISHLRPYIK